MTPEEKRKQEREAALNAGRTGGPVGKLNKEARLRAAREMGQIPGPEMEAKKEEEKGQRMARQARVKKEQSEESQARQPKAKQDAEDRMTRETVLGHLPGPAMEASKEIAKERRAREKEELPETKMWERGAREARQTRLKKEESDRRQASVDRGELPGPAMEREKTAAEESRAIQQASTDEEKKQKDIETAREAGLMGRPTPQQVAETRRSESKGEEPQVSSPPVAPAHLPADVLSTPADPISMPVLPTDRWNESVKTTEGGFIPLTFEHSVGKGGISPHGRIANRAPSRGFIHPFQMQPFWDSELQLTDKEQKDLRRSKGAWCCNVVPGFVNGHPPAVYMKRRYLPNDRDLRVYGNKYGKVILPPDPEAAVQVLLTDDDTPFIRITNFSDSRAKVVGASGVIGKSEVPLFFRVQGAFKAEELDDSDLASNALLAIAQSERLAFRILGGGEGVTIVKQEEGKDNLPEGNRFLLRADIVLQVDRPALKQAFAFDDIGLLRLTGFDIKLPQRNKYGARLYTVARYVPPEPPDMEMVLSGAYDELNFDEIVIATVWFLSPTVEQLNLPIDPATGFAVAPVPDGSWMSWTRGEIYWNLNYSSITQLDPVKVDTSLDYFKQILGVLAGGVAILIAYSYVNPIEAEYNKIQTALNQSIVVGAFWTG